MIDERIFGIWAVLVFSLALLTAPIPAHAQTAPAFAALIAAAERGDARAVAQLVAAGAAVDGRDPSGRTALLAATQGNHADAARVLIGAGADVNAKAANDDSPYLLAGAEGYLEILRMTLAAGADLGSLNRYGGTALIPAAHHGHVEAVRMLLGTEIDIDHVNRLGWTALLEAVILGDGGPRHIEIVKLLLAAGANAAIADAHGATALDHARRRGYADMIAALTAGR